MIEVVVLGAGNVASHFIDAFSNAESIDLVQVYARKRKSLDMLNHDIAKTTNLNQLKSADIYVIAIADDAIADFTSQLVLKNALVVHTSGSVSMDAIDDRFHRGVFYPLQTFTKNAEVDFSSIPICLEAQYNEDLVLLEKLASAISNNVYFIDSEQRESLHIAAVFVNNFTNHLYYIGHQICNEHMVPFQILKPLIEETAKKISNTFPAKAQTGPARRNDQKTIAKHLKHLPKEYQEIYKSITKSISKTYE